MKTSLIVILIVSIITFAGYESVHIKRSRGINHATTVKQSSQKKKRKNRLIKWTLRKLNKGRGYDFAHLKDSSHNPETLLADYVFTPVTPVYNYGDGQYFISEQSDSDENSLSALQQNGTGTDITSNNTLPIPDEVLRLLTEQQIVLPNQTDLSADAIIKLINEDKNLKAIASKNREALLLYFPPSP